MSPTAEEEPGGGAAAAPVHLAWLPRSGRPRSGCELPAGQPGSQRASACAAATRNHARMEQEGTRGAQGSRVYALAEPLAIPLRGGSKDRRTLRWEPEMPRFQLTILLVTRERLHRLRLFQGSPGADTE